MLAILASHASSPPPPRPSAPQSLKSPASSSLPSIGRARHRTRRRVACCVPRRQGHEGRARRFQRDAHEERALHRPRQGRRVPCDLRARRRRRPLGRRRGPPAVLRQHRPEHRAVAERRRRRGRRPGPPRVRGVRDPDAGDARHDGRGALLARHAGAGRRRVPVPARAQGGLHVPRRPRRPPAGAALGALLPRPRGPLLRLRPRPARRRHQRLRGLAPRPADPQPGDLVGLRVADGRREAAAGERASRLLQRALRAALGELHPGAQLHDGVRLPGRVGAELRGGLLPGHEAVPQPVQPAHGPRHHAPAVAQGLPVVRARPRRRDEHPGRREVLPAVPAALHAVVLPRRALRADVRGHAPRRPELEPHGHARGLVRGGRAPGGVRRRGGHAGAGPEHPDQPGALHAQREADDHLLPVRQEVLARRPGAAAQHVGGGHGVLNFVSVNT